MTVTDTAKQPALFREMERFELLTAAEEVALAQKIKRGDQLARDQMITANLRLVVKIARQHLGRGLPLNDLIQEGNLGLIHAVGKFDPDKGFRFSTYSVWWITQYIEMACMWQTRDVRLPVHVEKNLRAYGKKFKALQVDLSREPTEIEVAIALEWSGEKLRRLMDDAMLPLSFDVPVTGGDGVVSDLASLVADEGQRDAAFRDVADADSAAVLASALAGLDPVDRKVIDMRFDMNGEGVHSLKQVGAKIGIGGEWVRRRQLRALKQMREALEIEGISSGCVI